MSALPSIRWALNQLHNHTDLTPPDLGRKDNLTWAWLEYIDSTERPLCAKCSLCPRFLHIQFTTTDDFKRINGTTDVPMPAMPYCAAHYTTLRWTILAMIPIQHYRAPCREIKTTKQSQSPENKRSLRIFISDIRNVFIFC